MTDTTFTKTLAMTQQYIYRSKIVNDWEENDKGERYTIDVYLCQKYKADGEEVGGVLLKIIFNYGNGGTITRWVNPATTEENDIFEDNGEPYKRYYILRGGMETHVYIDKVYDMTETEGFKEYADKQRMENNLKILLGKATEYNIMGNTIAIVDDDDDIIQRAEEEIMSNAPPRRPR